MKRAFIYKDEKSHKFWWIDYSDCCLAVNYGKYGNIGKFDVKEFDREEECTTQAEKLILAKIKKGYVEDTHFDFINRFYLDNEEYGPHPKTSHPKFAEHFTEDFYYDCTNEESPFGSDEGNDTLTLLQTCIRRKTNFCFSDYPQYLLEKEWDIKYIPAKASELQAVKEFASRKEREWEQSDLVTDATAFAQIKITGSLSADLQERAVHSIQRLALAGGNGLTEIQNKMIADLLAFPLS